MSEIKKLKFNFKDGITALRYVNGERVTVTIKEVGSTISYVIGPNAKLGIMKSLAVKSFKEVCDRLQQINPDIPYSFNNWFKLGKDGKADKPLEDFIIPIDSDEQVDIITEPEVKPIESVNNLKQTFQPEKPPIIIESTPVKEEVKQEEEIVKQEEEVVKQEEEVAKQEEEVAAPVKDASEQPANTNNLSTTQLTSIEETLKTLQNRVNNMTEILDNIKGDLNNQLIEKEVTDRTPGATTVYHADRDIYEVNPLNLSEETLQKQQAYTKESVKESLDESLANTVVNVKILEDKELSNTKTKATQLFELKSFDEVYGEHNKNELADILRIKKALLLKSPPGNGKTTIARALASYIIEKDTEEDIKETDRIQMVCFSPTTSYSDFISGLRCTDNGTWKQVNGTFKKFCGKAKKDNNHKYVFIIDEINRADTESVLGEVMAAIEQRNIPVTTNNGDEITVPSNLYIIATMNEKDSSAKELDDATLDRFAIYEIAEGLNIEKIKTDADGTLVLAMEHVYEALGKINEHLEKDAIKGKQNIIGNRVMFTDFKSINDLKLVIKYDIEAKAKEKMKNLDEKDKEEIYDIINNLNAELDGDL